MKKEGLLLKWLRDEIWPKIHERLPHAKLHVYGAYPTAESCLSTKREKNFIVKGQIDDAYLPLSKARVNLAPLRYGAGIKGY